MGQEMGSSRPPATWKKVIKKRANVLGPMGRDTKGCERVRGIAVAPGQRTSAQSSITHISLPVG